MVVMTGHNRKTGLLVPDEHDHYSLQFPVTMHYESFGEVKVISCFGNRISPTVS